MGPRLNSLSQFPENLRKSLYKIENSGTFKNCESFSAYYFSYVRGYKAALRGGNKNNLSENHGFRPYQIWICCGIDQVDNKYNVQLSVLLKHNVVTILKNVYSL